MARCAVPCWALLRHRRETGVPWGQRMSRGGHDHRVWCEWRRSTGEDTAEVRVTGRDRVEDYLRHLAVERGRARNTLVSYRRDLRIYQDWLWSTGWSFDAIGEQQLTDFVRYLGAEREAALATSSVARILSAVRGLHRFLAEEGVTVVDAASQVRQPKLPRRLPKAIPVEEVTRLLAAAAGDDPVSLRNTALLE